MKAREKIFYILENSVPAFEFSRIPESSRESRQILTGGCGAYRVRSLALRGEAGLRFLAKFMMIKRSVRPEVRRLHWPTRIHRGLLGQIGLWFYAALQLR